MLKKKEMETKIILILFTLYLILIKIFYSWNNNVDTLWHLNSNNINSGFPLFFWIKDLFNLLTLNNAIIFLPLFFGLITMFLFFKWLKKKNINNFVLIFLLFLFQKQLILVFSFSRETIIIFLSLLFFYFLEKYFYKNTKKNLSIVLVFFVLACLTKITGFLLLIFLLLVLVQKKVNPLFVIPVPLVVLFMLFQTNLANNLSGLGFVMPDLVISFVVLLVSFLFYFCLFFKSFFSPKKFLWQVNFVVLLLLGVVGVKYGFLNDFLIVETMKRYFVIFLFPFIVWFADEFESYWSKRK